MSSPIQEHVDEKVMANRKRIRENKRRWREKNPEKEADSTLKSRLKRLYSMTVEDYELLLIKQGNVCAICEASCKTNNRLCVDHCHTSGEIRGLLCHRCNCALGLLDDNKGRINNMIKYLERDE